MKTDKLLLLVGAIGLTSLLLSDPRCRRGCRTVFEHLREHAIEEFFASLLG